MVEPNVTQTPVPGAQPAPEGAPVSQAAIVNDFQEEFVDQDAPDTPAQTGKTDPTTGKPEKKTPAQPPAPGAQPGGKVPARPDDLIKPFQDDKGTFSPDKYLDFFTNQKKPAMAPFKPAIVAPTPPAPGTENLDPAEKTYQEREKYATELRTSLFMYREFFNQAVKASYPPLQADAWAEQQVEARLNKHLYKYDYDNRVKEQSEEKKRQGEQLEVGRLKPLADSNRSIVAQEFGGLENLDRLLTHPELGGEEVLWLFNLQNPGAKYASAEEFRASLENWFIKTIAQNPDHIRRLAMIGLYKYRDRYFPQVVDHIKAKIAGAGPGRQRSVLSGTRTVTNPAPAKAPNSLDVFRTPQEQRETVDQDAT